jgi:hypothetical protein
MKTIVYLLALTGALAAQELPDKPQLQKKDRIFWMMPTSDVDMKDAPFVPLTAGEKFHLFTDTSFDRFTSITATVQAGINQAANVPQGYGQGGEGYAKRYGAAIADKVSSDFFKLFAYPTLFRQDPRYFTMTSAGGKNSKSRRLGYAMSRVFVTRGDNGNLQINFSNLVGNASASALTNVWYPPEDRDVASTLSRFGVRLGASMAGNVVKEFWSEIGGAVFRKKNTR